MLKVNDINVSFGKHHVLKDVSLEVQPGQIVGLIGPNGAGKSTTMKTILGLLKFKGSVTLNGRKVTTYDHSALKKVGALVEAPAVYPFLSGLENLKLYSTDHEDMKHIISILGMSSYINQKSKDYSVGMRQKLGIGIALLNKPALVILDEPMNGLDIESTIVVRKIIKEYAENGTGFLISSHILAELQKVMTDIVILKNGRTILNRSIEDLLKTNNQQYRLITQNMPKTIHLFTESKIAFSKDQNYLLVKKDDIDKVQALLYKNNIYISELSTDNGNLEKIVVQILENKGVQ